jgi:hypothetical protein
MSSVRAVRAIFCATVFGEPMNKAPSATSRPPTEAAFLADAVGCLGELRPVLLLCLLVRLGDVPRRMHADRLHRTAELRERSAEQLDVGPEAGGGTADDREHQPEAVARGTHDRLRAAVISKIAVLSGRAALFRIPPSRRARSTRSTRSACSSAS